MKRLRHFLLALLLTIPPLAVLAGDNQWTGSGPFATGAGNRVIHALATSPDGTLYAGSGSGTVFAYAAATPTATTLAASGIGDSAATLNGSINANGGDAAVSFEYGSTVAYGSSVAATPTPVTGVGDTAVAAAITGLACNTVYHFRVKAVNISGTAYGDDASFSTAACPPTYTLTYNGNGATSGSVPVDANAYLANAVATVAGHGNLQRSGFTFANWNTQADGLGTSYSAGAPLTITSSATLFAQWMADIISPTVMVFTATTPSPSPVPITQFTASDDNAVTGYLITESATPPAASAAGWSATAPSAFAAGLGSHMLYPWARDAAGNVSAVYVSPVTVQVCATAITVTNTHDAGAGSLRQAVADLCDGGSITIATTGTLALMSPLVVNRNATLSGPGAGSLTIVGPGNGPTIVAVSSLSVSGITFTAGMGTMGGAISGIGPLTVTSCAFIGNTAMSTGGAIFTPGAVNISNSTFSGNTAGAGGALAISSGTLDNVTFSGNSATGAGGAIYANGTALSLRHVTIAGNAASTGGGLAVANTTTISLANSIVAGNTGGDCVANSGATLTANSHNLDSDGSCGSASTATLPNLHLGTLADNGGPTQTIALLAGSPAIDAGDNAACLATDQRGIARPQGAACDGGAYEVQVATQLSVVGGNDQTTATGTAFALPLSVVVRDSNNLPLPGLTVSFAGPGSGAGINGGGTATSDASGIASFTVSANPIPGSYLVTASVNGLTANFSLTNQGNQAITGFAATPAGGRVGDSSTLSVTASGASGNAVVFGTTTSGTCSVSGNTVTYLAVGTCTLTANQAGNASYGAAPQVSISVAVTAGPLHTVTGDVGTGTITATVSGGNCEFDSYNFSATLPAAAPTGRRFPHGLFSFTLSHCTGPATVNLTYPSALPGDSQYQKYGPTNPSASPQWYVMPGATVSGNTAQFTLTDGQLGDDDWTLNGTIIDAGGPDAAAAALTGVPTLSQWALMLLAGLLALFGGAQRRRS